MVYFASQYETKGVFDWPYSVYSRIRIKLQKSLLIRRTIKYLVKSNDFGESYNLVVFFSNLEGIVANKIEQNFYSVYSYSGIESIERALSKSKFNFQKKYILEINCVICNLGISFNGSMHNPFNFIQ